MEGYKVIYARDVMCTTGLSSLMMILMIIILIRFLHLRYQKSSVIDLARYTFSHLGHYCQGRKEMVLRLS